MESFQVLFSKQAQKDIALLTSKQKEKLQKVTQQILAVDPYAGKALKGEMNVSAPSVRSITSLRLTRFTARLLSTAPIRTAVPHAPQGAGN